MRYITIKITTYLKTDRIMGMDGKIYFLPLWQPVTLPAPNAKLFLDRGGAELIDNHPDIHAQHEKTNEVIL